MKDFFFVKKQGSCPTVLQKIKNSEVLFIEANGDYLHICFGKSTGVTTHGILREFLKQLPAQFVRCHRSFIVNIENISTIEGETIFLNGCHIPISEACKKEFISHINLISATHENKKP